jgi:hypothetical protein
MLHLHMVGRCNSLHAQAQPGNPALMEERQHTCTYICRPKAPFSLTGPPPPDPTPTCEEAQLDRHVHHTLPVPLSTGVHHAQVVVNKPAGGEACRMGSECGCCVVRYGGQDRVPLCANCSNRCFSM